MTGASIRLGKNNNHHIHLITMKKRKNKKNKEKLQKPRKEISELIDELAYISEGENILNSKKFLDGLYMLEHD
ncbi:hypothetical protein CHA01nite_34110 [Chryseobacterium hagamense]|uniref:Uncharacterized protein n=2 Tax=Chryseobacterium hagamense TaxID=395935 RepID=A0A511YR57_9FLAO|nr:hypothetical protein CHA01nite_34110 [Chryseobacterium hagamense]